MDLRYPLIMATALVLCAYLLRIRRDAVPLKAGERLAVGIGAFCSAMLGAKLPFVLADWEGLLSGAVWFSSGKTIMCGLVGAYFGVEFTKWALEIRVKTGDWFAMPVAVAVGIGRIGCFVAGCCYGTPTELPWGVRFATADLLEGVDAPRHPTQLYESFFHFTMAAILWHLQKSAIWPGHLVKFYIIAYLVYRLISETIRPEARVLAGLTGYQWCAIGLIPVFAFLWYRDAQRMRESVSQLPAR